MTGELRVVVTGVQVLFAFLLVVPFDSGFAGIGPYERIVYFITLMLAAAATICTIAPSAHHRLLSRRDEKPVIVVRANQIVIAGVVCLALAILGSLVGGHKAVRRRARGGRGAGRRLRGDAGVVCLAVESG